MFIDINPIIFRVGFIQVSYYSLVYLIGFLVSLFILLRASRKREINLSEDEVYDFIFFLILGLFVGARAFHILFWDFEYFSANLGEIPKIWNGGLSFYGGLIGVLLVCLVYTRAKKISFYKLADILVLPAVFFLAFGRIANFINQEIVGVVTNVSWCFNFDGVEGCRHPVQLYASFGRFVLFGFLLYIKTKIKDFKEGFLFWMFIVFIGAGRFFLDYLREDVRYFYLSFGQWFSLIALVIGFYVLLRDYRIDLKRVFRVQ